MLQSLRLRRLLPVLLATGLAMPAAAEDLRLQPGASSSDIKALSEDLSAAFSYKALGAASSFGVAGVGVAGYATYVRVDDKDAWQRATGERNSSLRTYGLRARKGLPGGVDVSAFYAQIAGSDGSLVGGAVQYALLKGSAVTPGVALRAGYSRLNSVDDLDFDSWSLDATVSKGFPLLTPYGGVGMVSGSLDPADPALSSERSTRARAFAGLRVSLGLLDVTPEIEQSGSNTAVNLRLGLTL